MACSDVTGHEQTCPQVATLRSSLGGSIEGGRSFSFTHSRDFRVWNFARLARAWALFLLPRPQARDVGKASAGLIKPATHKVRLNFKAH